MSACRVCQWRANEVAYHEGAVRAAARKAARTERPAHIDEITKAKADLAENRRWLEAHRAECEVVA